MRLRAALVASRMPSDTFAVVVPPHDGAHDASNDRTHFASLKRRTEAYASTLLRARPSSARRHGTIRALSWNCQLLRGVGPAQGGRPRDLMKRAQKIGAQIAAIAETIDVVCLQEVWHDASRRELTRRLIEGGFDYVYAPKHRCGLLVASKRSQVCNMFSPFPSRGMEALFFTKGCTTTLLRLSDASTAAESKTRVAVVLNAHAQSDFWSSGASVRCEQFQKIRLVMDRAVEECQGNGYVVDRILLCGDLNVACNSDEYEAMMRGPFFGAVDLMLPPQNPISSPPVAPGESDRRNTFPTGRWRHNFLACCGGSPSGYEESIPRVRLDYVLDLTPLITRSEPTHAHVDEGFVHQQLLRGVDGEVLSDHAPIVAFSSTYVASCQEL